MSINLFIAYSDPWKEDRLYPIASEGVFDRYWRPLCQSLRLRWVPRFEDGCPLTAEDIPHILNELRQLRSHLVRAADADVPIEVNHQMLARISVLARELNEIQKIDHADAFIGNLAQTQRRLPNLPGSRLLPF